MTEGGPGFFHIDQLRRRATRPRRRRYRSLDVAIDPLRSGEIFPATDWLTLIAVVRRAHRDDPNARGPDIRRNLRSAWAGSQPSGRFHLRLSTRSGRVGMCRGGGRFGVSVAAPFVWRCPSNLAVAPLPHPSHRTGRADLPHPALGQDVTLSPTPRCALARSSVRARSARRGARVDRSRPCVA